MLWAVAGAANKDFNYTVQCYHCATSIIAPDQKSAEESSLKHLKEKTFPKDEGYKDVKVVTSKISPDFFLLSKGIVDKTWQQKVEWAKGELIQHLMDGKFDETLNYVLSVVAE